MSETAAAHALPGPTSRRQYWLSLARATAFYGGIILVIWLIFKQLDTHRGSRGGLIALGALGLFRYTWLIINLVRSYIYRFYAYPRLRQAAMAIEYPFPEQLHVIIPTYKEKPWVTRKMLATMTREAASIPSLVRLYITTGGPDEDQVVREALAECIPNPRLTVHMMRQAGKRYGMAYALRAANRINMGEKNSVVVLMDGDTLLGQGLLRKSLPFFALLPKVGGITTNSIALTTGPDWYRKWYTLRFSLRNRYMCSTSLSHKVLTLTGRFSFVRSDIALGEEFIERVERDSIDDWLYGRINFKTGDDKSTWYTLLRNGWEMLYLPDANIYCLENASDKPLIESVGKMRRWFGNMLRNNGRALALGPKKVGFFAWFSLLDQRISMWTSLVLPTGVLILIFTESPLVILYFTIWVLSTRLLYLVALAVEGHPMSLWDLPLLLYQQWVGSFIKVQTMSDLRRQKWGAARGDAKTSTDIFGPVQTCLWLAVFGLIVALLVLG